MPGLVPNARTSAGKGKSEETGLSSKTDQFAPGSGAVGELAGSRFASSRKIADEVAADPEKKKLYDTAVEFQAIFVNMMLKSMRATLNKENDMLHGGRPQEIFEDMLYDEYSKVLSRQTRFGLAEQIFEQFTRPPSSTIPGTDISSDSAASAGNQGTSAPGKSALEQMRAGRGYDRQMLPLPGGALPGSGR